jgi:hypothetical protein
MVIAQISAMHVRPEGSPAYNGVDSRTFLVRTVEHLRALRGLPSL